MEMLRNAINWFEIPVTDFERAKQFYSTIYDYEMPDMQMGPIHMGFFLHDRDNGGIGGCIAKGEGYIPSPAGPKVYLNAGKDLNTVLSRVEGAGGKVIFTKMSIGDNMGCIGMFRDTEGNHICLHSTE